MPMSPMDIEKLKSDLTADADLAKERANSAFATRGAPEEPSYAPKALRIKNQVVGKAELDAATKGVDDLIGQLKTEAGFKDQIQSDLFTADLKKRMNQYRLYLMRQAGMAQKKIAEMNIDAQKKQQMMNAIASLASNSTAAIVMGIGNNGGGGTPIADSMKAPSIGSQFNTPGPSLLDNMAPSGPSLGSFKL